MKPCRSTPDPLNGGGFPLHILLRLALTGNVDWFVDFCFTSLRAKLTCPSNSQSKVAAVDKIPLVSSSSYLNCSVGKKSAFATFRSSALQLTIRSPKYVSYGTYVPSPRHMVHLLRVLLQFNKLKKSSFHKLNIIWVRHEHVAVSKLTSVVASSHRALGISPDELFFLHCAALILKLHMMANVLKLIESNVYSLRKDYDSSRCVNHRTPRTLVTCLPSFMTQRI